ncbi:MAG: helix-turn-helix domain-containing protein [Candidatus Aenigmatarchaeota archaeon]
MRTIYGPKIVSLDPLEEGIMNILLDGKERTINALHKEVLKLNISKSRKTFFKRLKSLEEKGLIVFEKSPKHKRAKIVRPVSLIREVVKKVSGFKYEAYNYMTLAYLELSKEKDKHKIFEKLKQYQNEINQAFVRELLNIETDYRNEVKQFLFNFLVRSLIVITKIWLEFKEQFISFEEELKILKEEKEKARKKYSIEELLESKAKFEKLRDKMFRKFENLWEKFWFELVFGKRELKHGLSAPAGI